MAFDSDDSFFYYQINTSISFWCRWGLNPRSLIQPSKTLIVELIRTHNIDKIEISWDVRALTLILRIKKLIFNLSLYIYIYIYIYLTFWFSTFSKWRIVWYVHFSIPYSMRLSQSRRITNFLSFFPFYYYYYYIIFCLSLSSTLLCFLATFYTSNTGHIFFFF